MPFTPTVPVNAAGWRIEPPVSVPVAPKQRSAATAVAEPPEEPPGVRVSPLAPFQGLLTGPVLEVSFDEPIANSSIEVLHRKTPPFSHQDWVTVDS